MKFLTFGLTILSSFLLQNNVSVLAHNDHNQILANVTKPNFDSQFQNNSLGVLNKLNKFRIRQASYQEFESNQLYLDYYLETALPRIQKQKTIERKEKEAQERIKLEKIKKERQKKLEQEEKLRQAKLRQAREKVIVKQLIEINQNRPDLDLQNNQKNNQKGDVQNNQEYNQHDYIVNLIQERCQTLGCNTSQLLRVMHCESTNNPAAYNYSSGATGLFQFMPPTFYSNAKHIQLQDPDIWNPKHQVLVATDMFSRGQAFQWVCK